MQKTAYALLISDWSSDVCSSDLIFGTRPWTRHEGKTGEGHDVRFTTKDDSLFAIIQGTPTSDVVELDVTPPDGATANVLGHDQPLARTPTASGAPVPPPARPPAAPAMALRIPPAPR